MTVIRRPSQVIRSNVTNNLTRAPANKTSSTPPQYQSRFEVRDTPSVNLSGTQRSGWSPPAPTPPDWMRRNTRPPNIDARAWNHLPQEDRQAVLDSAWNHWNQALADRAPPKWMAQGTRPPDISAQTWNHLPREDQQAIIDHAREQWSAYVNESMGMIAKGVPPEGTFAASPQQAADGVGFGQGVTGQWQTYQGSPNAAQYLDLSEMLGAGYPAAHFNLCGELSVASALGMTPKEALELFRDNVSASILRDPTQGTLGGDLVKMFEAAGWSAEWRNQSTDPATVTTPEELRALLDEGKELIALVNMDTTQDGRLMSTADSTKDIAHWVRIMGVEQTATGETVVRVYNPFQNREEVYPWDTFEASWAATNGNYTQHGLVVADPP